MFYCDDCAEKKKWPLSILNSLGLCEICEENKICNDLPSKMLPLPDIKKTKIYIVTNSWLGDYGIWRVYLDENEAKKYHKKLLKSGVPHPKIEVWEDGGTKRITENE